MIGSLKNINLGVRFGLEMALVAAFGLYGWRTLPSGALRVTATVVVPVVVMTIWATVVHGAKVPSPVAFATQVLLFALAVIAIVALGRPEVAVIFTAAVIANATLIVAWGQ